MKILLTGICGFSGSHLAERILADTDWDIVGLEKYSYAGLQSNIAHLDQSRIKLVYHDFAECLDPIVGELGKIDLICHAGAETHVKNSLADPAAFVAANVMGTFNMLEAAKWLKPKKFLYVSTDEVFGASTTPKKEDDALNPSNPYSATKAAGEYLVKAFGKAYGIPWLISRTSNIYGKRQHAEKMIPLVLKKIQDDGVVEIHTDADGHVGSRQWIHASEQAAALIFLLQSPVVNETFHIAGTQVTNSGVVQSLLAATHSNPQIQFRNALELHKGHDLHYALDSTKLEKLGWKLRLTFEEGLALTV